MLDHAQALKQESTEHGVPGSAPAAETSIAQPSPPVQGAAAASIRDLLRPHAFRAALAAVCLALASLCTLLAPVCLRRLLDAVTSANGEAPDVASLQWRFLQLFGVVVAIGLFTASRHFLISWLSERFCADIRTRIYSRLIRQEPVFFESRRTGELLSSLMSDTSVVQSVLGTAFSIGVRNAIVSVGAMAMLVYTMPSSMLPAIVAALLATLPAVKLGQRVRQMSRAAQDQLAASTALASEVLSALSVVQSHGAEDREDAHFDAASRVVFSSAVSRSFMRSLLFAFVTATVGATLICMLYIGTRAVMAGTMSPGRLGEAIIYVVMLLASASALGEVYGEWLRAAGCLDRLLELLRISARPQTPAGAPHIALPDLASGCGIRFEDVGFSYPSRPAQCALDRVSFEVPAGRTVALVGPSGAGKSTLFQLLLRFYEPGTGSIVINGAPIAFMDMRDVRSMIAFVPQDPVVFSSSVADNIRYGRPGASDEDVERAARAAHAHDFISALPQGYATPLGERGVRLSGGQRQRIAIARAMLRDAPILLLDEATSALDSESERHVKAAIEAARAGRTTLVIAHRLSTVQHADLIVVMDGGRVVEQGTHASLSTEGGLYARLAAVQFA